MKTRVDFAVLNRLNNGFSERTGRRRSYTQGEPLLQRTLGRNRLQ